MGKYFGTDGLRGKVGKDLTPEIAFSLGRAAASVLIKNKEQQPATVIIGKDTRLSGDLLESALASGMSFAGVNILLLGIIPTPGVAALCRDLNADAGVVISASHNPYYDNGIKFFTGSGFKLPDEVENEIEYLLDHPEQMQETAPDHFGRINVFAGAAGRYSELLLADQHPDLHGLKLVVDTANGAAAPIAGKLFSSLGAEVIGIGASPNGVNINDGCGSTHPERLADMVVRENADLGIAFDGDADRLQMIDAYGELIDGDFLMAIITKNLLDRGELANNRLTVTQMSNLGLRLAMESLGVMIEETKVGDRYVLERMLETGGIIGGEQSGHLILLKHNSTGDGIAAALKVLTIIKESALSLAELKAVMQRLPQVLVNVEVKNKDDWANDRDIIPVIDNAKKVLNGKGRILIRPSGTESKIRVMAEGPDEAELHDLVENIAEIIRTKLG